MWIQINSNQPNWNRELLSQIKQVFLAQYASMFRTTQIDNYIFIHKFASRHNIDVSHTIKLVLDSLNIEYEEAYSLEKLIVKYNLLGKPIDKSTLQTLGIE